MAGTDENISRAKQLELMFQDAITVIADRKLRIFEVSRWMVTLQGLIVGLVATQRDLIGEVAIGMPILIGGMGLWLNRALQGELNSHRKILARIRATVGGDFLKMHRDMVGFWLWNVPAKSAYWQRIDWNHLGIICISSLLATMAVIAILSGDPNQGSEVKRTDTMSSPASAVADGREPEREDRVNGLPVSD